MNNTERIIEICNEFSKDNTRLRKENNDVNDFITNFILRIPRINSGDINIDSGYNMCLNEVYKIVSAFYDVKYEDVYKKAGVDIRKLQGIVLN